MCTAALFVERNLPLRCEVALDWTPPQPHHHHHPSAACGKQGMLLMAQRTFQDRFLCFDTV